MGTTPEESMNARMAITAAEPSRLFGLLKESFAGGAALAKAAADPNANPLVKAVVADFQTSDGRAAAHDGLKAEFANSRSNRCARSRLSFLQKLPATPPPSRVGFVRSAKRPPRRLPRAEVCLEEEFKSATRKKQHLVKFPLRSASDLR